MSVAGKAALIIVSAVISGAGLAVARYYTYKYFESKRCLRETDSRSSESYHTASEYQSDSEYFDADEDELEKDQLFESVDKLMQGDESNVEAAYLEMKDSFEFMSEDPNFLWRYAKVHFLRGKVSKNEAQELTEEGLKYAEKAVEIDRNNSEAHKWFAILTGMKAEFSVDFIKKAENAKTFFRHIQEALKLRPKDWELHHLLGVFEYKLASLNFIEKLGARQIFKGISNCEYTVARDHFRAAEKYNRSSSKETKLFLAKCLCQEKNYKEALKCLKEASKLEVKSIDDKALHEEVEHQIRLLKKSV